jgi:predicted AlkP superfamily pyrophosphatase or phosphodiesterase
MTTRPVTLIPILLTAGSLVLGAQSRSAAPPQQTPKRATPPLVVLVVVDQFRADYVQRYGSQWSKGLRRLIDHGAYFPLAAYPYAVTLTCAGHSTIGTGAFPRTHGMIANAWYDRATKRSTTCTSDPAVTSVPFGGRAGSEQHSPRWMMTTTFADELRNQAAIAPHIASVSLKARAAIGMAGHGGDLVAWEEDDGTWATSSAFAQSARADVDAFATSHAVDLQYGRVWDRLLPASKYFFPDDAPGEPRSAAGSSAFPHALTRPGGQPDAAFVTAWEHTPFGDEILADMAIAFSDGMGKGAGTDMLAVSFSALDLVGHQYGSKSHEVQDVLARLDVQLGRLFDTLDRRVGAGRYVVALSADHGSAPIPEQVAAMGLDAGRYTSASIIARIVEAWKPFATDAMSPVASGTGADIYFTPAALSTIKTNPAARQAVTSAVLSSPAIARAFWADELAQGDAGDDPVKRAELLSFVPSRSADLLLVPKQYWMATSSGATHGTPYAYDQRVPVVLMGFGIRPGQYLTTVSPADIAPTFALLTGITLPHADGRPLTEAVIR